jgi:hypothetical protein
VRINGDAIEDMKDVWVYLAPDEAHHVLESLKVWTEEVAEGHSSPGWHMHVTDSGRELTLAIDPADDGTSWANPSS